MYKDIKELEIKGVYLIEPKVFEDSRGYFFESFNQEEFNKATNANFIPVQDNESKSSYGVLRGLHFQNPPFEQAKLVRVVKGIVLDFAIDLRLDSPTRGKYVYAKLSEENKKQLFIPRGFAHGFLVLSPEAIFQYKCDNYYHPEAENGIAWNDEDIHIPWKDYIDLTNIVLSEKDKDRQSYKEYIKNNK